ncbi:hypothetical protein, unlikely [Trypanosoma brucei gambiense DAL972]|uniref:Uncharacterized protein n=1 Tax=Trypanosoma brucei gambiense (strain MHOM/CI/86/DAL972) TaxID=679716 RepID=C9ZWM3_TRYB9|nr:hypothetical protein, unlikely [Trypanosoma brucei gambiense DAL972]CBH13812.1 hypothetical protein, unlikely [Trypanosoma brucei gambiense DAL972]|eukprot:XP_011776088.1 hypothetical protein, unlikely [Trypanosoma brucei gambiense DAL972]
MVDANGIGYQQGAVATTFTFPFRHPSYLRERLDTLTYSEMGILKVVGLRRNKISVQSLCVLDGKKILHDLDTTVLAKSVHRQGLPTAAVMEICWWLFRLAQAFCNVQIVCPAYRPLVNL